MLKWSSTKKSSSYLCRGGKNASLGMGILQGSDNWCADLTDLVFSCSYLYEIVELIFQLLSVPLSYVVSSKDHSLGKAVRTSYFMNFILTAVQEYDAAEYPQRVGRQKHLLDIDIHFADSRRGSRGRGRGGPRGRGGLRGAGGASRNGAPGSRMGGSGDARGPGVSRFSELQRIPYVFLRILLFKIFHSKCLVLLIKEIFIWRIRLLDKEMLAEVQ
jgi:hypothetical protein